ncbi:MAG: hypothetical protein GQ582_00130 [Methyloprofundus sp.]|nr:hypothetical protein [Methyloprofundus sp.]
MSTQIHNMAAHIDGLKALFIIAMPDALLFDSWTSTKQNEWDSTQIASYFGDMVRANRQGLNVLSAWSDEMQITVETGESRLVMHELKNDFVAVAIFEARISLGMLRLELKRLLENVNEILPVAEIERRSQGIRIVDFLLRYAPDPHAVLARVSLMTGISLEQLKNPVELSDEEAASIKESAKTILGLSQIDI